MSDYLRFSLLLISRDDLSELILNPASMNIFVPFLISGHLFLPLDIHLFQVFIAQIFKAFPG